MNETSGCYCIALRKQWNGKNIYIYIFLFDGKLLTLVINGERGEEDEKEESEGERKIRSPVGQWPWLRSSLLESMKLCRGLVFFFYSQTRQTKVYQTPSQK